MNPALLLVISEHSGKILAAQFVPSNQLQYEHNRLFEHFQFGNSDWDTLTPVSKTAILALAHSQGRIEPKYLFNHRLLPCRRADLP